MERRGYERWDDAATVRAWSGMGRHELEEASRGAGGRAAEREMQASRHRVSRTRAGTREATSQRPCTSSPSSPIIPIELLIFWMNF
jgi:hypothetical protein